MANAEVWLNGVSLGQHPYGYTPARFDLTPHLKPGAENVLSVRLDNSAQPNSRWYTGAGLYRPAWLRLTDPVHVTTDGVYVTTSELSAARARLRVETALRNESTAAAEVMIETEILESTGKKVAMAGSARTLAAGEATTVVTSLDLESPHAWSPESPVLYRAVTRVRSGTTMRDETATTFGVRTVRISAERGLELNGRPVKLFGGNVHHDNGVLGAAAFDRAEERKVELLKAAGFNAVRTAHNPPSAAFLAACDRLGLLVMDEIYDGWKKAKTPRDYSVVFDAWWRRDVDTWIRRDRNHPSVVLWSTGNEMYERAGAGGQRIARELVDRIRALDATRPITAGVNGLGTPAEWPKLDALFATFDVAGYNYELTRAPVDHARLPGRVILATESYQSEAFANWRTLSEAPYVIGDVVWSALDYLGEAGIGRVFPPDEPAKKHWEADMFPWHGAYCGDIDLTGWRKPISHYRNVVWDRGEKLYAAVLAPAPGGRPWNVTPWSMAPALPSWTWPVADGTPLTVEVYSRHEAVRLSLNGHEVGEQPTTLTEEFRTTFTVPYAPGELRVEGLRDGRVVETFTLTTAGPAVALRLTADRAGLKADGQDLSFVTLEAVDGAGRWNPTAKSRVKIAVSGAGTLAAGGTGDMTATDSYAGDGVQLFQGRAVVVVRAAAAAGPITVVARAADGIAGTCTLTAEQPKSSR